MDEIYFSHYFFNNCMHEHTRLLLKGQVSVLGDVNA